MADPGAACEIRISDRIDPQNAERTIAPADPCVVGIDQLGIDQQMLAVIQDDITNGRFSFQSNCRHQACHSCFENLRRDRNEIDSEYTPWRYTQQGGSTWKMTSRQILADNLKILRARKGLSQEALADAAEIDRTYVSSLERKKYSASIDRLDRLAAQLDVPTHYLLMPNMPTGERGD